MQFFHECFGRVDNFVWREDVEEACDVEVDCPVDLRSESFEITGWKNCGVGIGETLFMAQNDSEEVE